MKLVLKKKNIIFKSLISDLKNKQGKQFVGLFVIKFY